MEPFKKKRQQFYQQIDKFWHDLYETEYALFDVKCISRETMENIRLATERIGLIYTKCAQILRQVPDETLLQLGFPHTSIDFIRLRPIPFESVIARMDLVVQNEKIKLLEYNSDTPTFIKETFFVNGKVCEAFGVENPNAGCEVKLQRAIKSAVNLSLHSIDLKTSPNIVFSSHGDHDEDRFTTMYLKRLFARESQYLSLSDLRLIDAPVMENGKVLIEPGLYDQQGRKIDLLYRQTYPIEHLIDDQDPNSNENVGQLLLKFVQEKRLAILNPASSFLLQSKAVMALIWGLYEEKHPFLSSKELEWIETYFLPTYLDDDLFISQGVPYVRKPAFGREGDTVEIFNGCGEKIETPKNQTYQNVLQVYQQFIELPTTQIQTEQGKKLAHYMFGSFYINGEASAIGIRAGAQITDNESYFLPVGLAKGDE
ncbi:glutathionylspermidine synthase [Ureibacillus xyleni]|uniref:Glutathionylspermidine synthase n=1 Tax=Ureibacillus xyleni TaxID=614648 RepID=A0A285SHR6_9BACL|nr:glutathionylspermidine synthase family protein [Ureibacillus xyleni]SOC05308.1 glutathionylspermidine synthase [Ureibacillus xyleni]